MAEPTEPPRSTTEDPSLDILTARRLSEHLGMPRLCPLAACRRSGRCPGSVAEGARPRCTAPLLREQRRMFEMLHDFATTCLSFARDRAEPASARPPTDPVKLFLLETSMHTACAVLASQAGADPALRRWLRRRGRRALKTAAPEKLARFMQTFRRPLR
ncbi:hypothetical protein [Rhizobium binxianense]